jgi:hypothetical protein
MTGVAASDTASAGLAPHEDVPPADADDGPEADGTVTAGELIGVVAAILVGSVGAVSLALAQLGRHDGWLAVGLGTVLAAALSVVMVVVGRRPRLEVDRVEVVLLLATAVAAAFFFLPGFPYATVDKDPGVYVAHGFAIAEHGDVTIDDEVLERDLSPRMAFGGRFSGLWVEADEPDAVTPQFYHLHPATLATAADLVGSRGVFHLTPALAVLSVCLLTLAVRRATTTITAVVFAALIVTSMMQVWQAKYPSTEILAQFLVAGSLLSGVIAVQQRWAGAAFAAGVLLGVGFLARPDGFLYILLAVAVVAFALAAGRADRRAALLGVGLAISCPYAVWNAYVARIGYSEANGVPSLRVLLAASAALLVGGVVARPVLDRLAARLRARGTPDGGAASDDPGADDRPAGLFALLERVRIPLGVLVTVVFSLVLLGLWHRQTLLGVHYRPSPFTGETERSLRELNIVWFSYFVTPIGLVLIALGVAVVALTRMRRSIYLLVLPGLLLLPLYLWNAKISMRLMWWVRRFVPAALPAVLILVAVALAWALLRRSRLVQAVGAVVVVGLVASYAHMSLPLRRHHEMAGSWEFAEAVSDLAGDEQGVFLFTDARGIFDPMRNAPAAVWFIFDEISVWLPRDYDLEEIETYQEAFPDQPVFLVTHGDEDLPEGLPPDRFAHVDDVQQKLTLWEESRGARPDEDVVMRQTLSFWQLVPA